nr:unnamed protein product [Callosobruchus chinensis]
MPRKSELLSEEAQAVNSPVRRSTRLSQTREATPAEPAPAASIRSRRWSASDHETAENKSLKGTKGSQDAVDTKTPTRATRGRRSSITTETIEEEPKPDAKKSTRKSMLSESSETKVTPRATRRRSASVDDGLVIENAPITRSRRQSLEPLEADVEAKRVTRSRRASIEKQEEPEIVHTPKKTTVTKPKRRASVTLDPIEEQTESRKSASPLQDTKELSVILENSLREETIKSGPSSPEKLKARSSKSPLLTEETGKLNTMSPRRSTRRSSSKSPVVTEIHTPKTRRSLMGSNENIESKPKEKQNGDERIPDEADKIEHEEDRGQMESEEKQIGEVEDTADQAVEQKPQLNDKIATGEESNAPLSKSQDDTENLVLNDTNIQVEEEEKENVFANSNQENIVDGASPIDKILILKENSSQETQIRNPRVSLGRVSNVFRPKDAEFSFAEPMEVDELSMLNDTRKTNIDLSRVRDSSIDESVDESFKLTLNETAGDKDDAALAGTKTEGDGVAQMKDCDEATQKIRLSEGQTKLLNGINADEETCQSDEYQFEVPSDDDTESVNLKTGKEEENAEGITDPPGKEVIESQPETVDTNHSERKSDENETSAQLDQSQSEKVDPNQEEENDDYKESEISTQLDQSRSEKAGSNQERNTDENEAEKDVEAHEESEIGSQLDRSQSEKAESNQERNTDKNDVENVRELDISAPLDQSQSEKAGSNQERNTDENEAEKDVEAHKESEIGSQLDQSQSEKAESNQERNTDKNDVENVRELDISAPLDQSQSEKAESNQERNTDENDSEEDVEEPEASAQPEQNQSEKVDAHHTERKADENDVEIDNYHEKTTVLEDTNNEVQSEQTQMDQTLQIPPEELENNIKDKEKPSEVVDLESTTVDDERAGNCQTESDTLREETHEKVDTMNGDCVEEDDINMSHTKGTNHRGSLDEDSVIRVTDNSTVTPDMEACAVEGTNVTNEVTVDSPTKIAKSKPEVANTSSLSENESEWATTSSKSSESNVKEVVEIDSSPEKGNTPDRRGNKRTRKLLRTVERNSTKNPNHDDSVVVVSETELNVSNKIQKYLDSKIADILQVNSSAKVDGIFLDDADSCDSDDESEEEESNERNEYLDTMAEEGEEDTPSEDSNAIIDEGESVGSSDSERPETDEYDSDDSFICDDDEEELLPGYEFDLADVDSCQETKRKSRIINVDNEDTDVIIMPKKEQSRRSRKASSRSTDDSVNRSKDEDDLFPDHRTSLGSGAKNKGNKRRSRIIDVDNEDTDLIIPKKEKRGKRSSRGTSDAEDAVVPVEETYESSKPTVQSQPETSARKSSITILENVNVKDIKDPCMSERIHSLMESFTTNIKEGDIAMNLSLEYTNDSVLGKKAKKRKSDSSEAEEAGSKKTKINVQDSNTAVTSKKSKKKPKITSSEDLKTKTFSLMNQLITDVKNRPKRSIKPSLNMESSWAVEKVKAKPSVSMIGKKEIEEFKAKKVHPKDLRQKLLYNSGRVNRIDTKTLLKKRAGI